MYSQAGSPRFASILPRQFSSLGQYLLTLPNISHSLTCSRSQQILRRLCIVSSSRNEHRSDHPLRRDSSFSLFHSSSSRRRRSSHSSRRHLLSRTLFKLGSFQLDHFGFSRWFTLDDDPTTKRHQSFAKIFRSFQSSGLTHSANRR